MNKQDAKFIPKLTPNNDIDNENLSNKEFFDSLILPILPTDSEETQLAKNTINGYLFIFSMANKYPGTMTLILGIIALMNTDTPKQRKELWILIAPIITIILNRVSH